MLASDSPAQRAAAVRSNKLPPKEKMAYLEKGCAVNDHTERITIAEDADTPVEVLQCLANKPGPQSDGQPSYTTPTSELEDMSQSPEDRQRG